MPIQRSSGNHLLDALPARTRGSLLAQAESVHLDRGRVQFDQGEPISTVHFPTTAVLSLVTLLRDGTVIEISTIGNEGTTAVPVFLGPRTIPNARCVCQVEGDAIVVRADDLLREVERSPALRDLMNRYVAALLIQIGQAVACSRLHNTTQRCARWLLMTHDRVGSDEFHLTHEFLGFMLGARRASVTEVLGKLNKSGVLRSHRGDIQILDRGALHRLSCECYDIMDEAMQEVVPAGRR